MQRGFTLVEFSIVLILIGLVIGGILVGRDMIAAANVRSTVAQIEEFNAAANTFKVKFNCVPGDCLDPDAMGFVDGDIGTDGNGDGRITGTFVVPLVSSHESYNFWYHLSQAQMVKGEFPGSYNNADAYNPSIPGTHFPLSKMDSGGIWVSHANYIRTGVTSSAAPYINYFWIVGNITDTDTVSIRFRGALSPTQNHAIDSKIDDGLPMAGNVRLSYYNRRDIDTIADTTAGMIYGVYGAGGATSNVCGNSSVSPPVYNVQNNTRHANTLCMLQIKVAF